MLLVVVLLRHVVQNQVLTYQVLQNVILNAEVVVVSNLLLDNVHLIVAYAALLPKDLMLCRREPSPHQG